MSISPVSYTHLDVYKRQEVTTVVEGLGSVQAIQDLFVAHAQAAIDSLK